MNVPPNWAPPGHPGGHQGNFASGDAQVGQQIGVIHGDANFYGVNQDDSPERKFEVALNHLRAGVSRFAQDILRDLIQAGHGSNKMAYYYALAVLSGRSLNEVDATVYSEFHIACQVAVKLQTDQWRTALELVQDLMLVVWEQEAAGVDSSIAMEKVATAFGELPAERQDEISKHLDMILSGAVQDQLAAIEARRIRADRMENDRNGRAWKFFEPDPAHPRPFVPPPTQLPTKTWMRLGLGGFSVLIGLAWMIGSIANGLAVPAVIGTVLLAAGGYLVVAHGVVRRVLLLRFRAREFELNRPDSAPISPGHWVSTTFVRDIHQFVDDGFRDARPHVAGSWDLDTRGLRANCKARFVTLYGNAQVKPAAINWLIRWHAKRVAEQWLARSMYSHRLTAQPSRNTKLLFGLGIGVSALALIIFLAAGGQLGSAAVFCGVGGVFAVMAAIDLLAARRFDEAERADNMKLFGEEQAAFADWQRVLEDRPSDAEMARWLDLDRAFLRMSALTRCALNNRDLVAHVVLTEGATNAKRARVLHGPPRYSDYVVLVFLLTRSGVREVEVDLNFLDGSVRDERRSSFRYDALASASVNEEGVRYAEDGRHLVKLRKGMPPDALGQFVRSRVFRLSLLSGEEISVVAENYERLADDERESMEHLMTIALATSGIAGALHVLEAVAAEGRDWIAREQERRRRRSQDWREGEWSRGQLGGGLVTLTSPDEPEEPEEQDEAGHGG